MTEEYNSALNACKLEYKEKLDLMAIINDKQQARCGDDKITALCLLKIEKFETDVWGKNYKAAQAAIRTKFNVAAEVDEVKVDEVAAEVDEVKVDEVAAEVDDVKVDEVAAEVDDVKVDEVKVDEVAAEVDEVAAEVDEVAAEVDEVAAEVDEVAVYSFTTASSSDPNMQDRLRILNAKAVLDHANRDGPS
jgi:outer membrane murein-binding lipoprotein Lpp